MVDISDPNVVQTEELCIEAVKQFEYVLRYVHNQTESICIEAVKKNGYALQYVHNQTESICMEAVKQDGYALKYVHNQTENICLEAFVRFGDYFVTFFDIYHAIKYPSPQLITELLKLYPSRMNTIMSTYATNIMKTYKAGSDAICIYIVQYANDLLYRPNNVNALVSHARWYVANDCAKTVFLIT